MGIIGFHAGDKPESVIHRIVWFELQVAPFSYRFAIIPKQPMLIGFEGENGEKGSTLLIQYEHSPEIFEKIVERIDNLARRSGILELPPSNPNQAFADDMIKDASVHIRIAYSDNRRWASYYKPDDIPREVASLIQDTKILAKQIMKEQSKQNISGDAVLQHIEPARNAAQTGSPQIVVKITVQRTGIVLVNQRQVSLSELGSVLDDLKAKNGEVWYYRELPEEEPSESTALTIQKVLDAVASRKLPIRLQTEEY